jgi:hypothetical protein
MSRYRRLVPTWVRTAIVRTRASRPNWYIGTRTSEPIVCDDALNRDIARMRRAIDDHARSKAPRANDRDDGTADV